MITSIHNPKIQWVRTLLGRSKTRHAEGLFVVEGVRLCEEALVRGGEAKLVLFSDELPERGKDIVDGFASQGVPVEQLTATLLRSISDTETPQGVLTVLRIPQLPRLEKLDFALIMDGVRDPGNLGTMLRTAAAAGVQEVFIPPGTVDPFSPKVVRAGMGAHFRLPISLLPWSEIAEHVKNASLKVILAAVEEGEVYYQVDLLPPLALIIGGEAEGASEAAYDLAEAKVHIPMPGGGESLNVATATAILLFEVLRQRELKP